ncbi:hypothetical protein Tco_1224508, partial [Tanacetum coccineum]
VSEAKDTASPAALTPPSSDYVLASLDYVLALDTKTEPFTENPQEAEHDPEESLGEDPP